MAKEIRSVGLDEIVSSAADGVLRAFEARKLGSERLTVDGLVRSGFNVRLDIWAGGPWIRALSELNPQPLPPVDGGRLSGMGSEAH